MLFQDWPAERAPAPDSLPCQPGACQQPSGPVPVLQVRGWGVLRRSYPPRTWRAMHRTASQSFACPAMSPSTGKGVSKTESDGGKDPKMCLIIKSNLNVTVFLHIYKKRGGSGPSHSIDLGSGQSELKDPQVLDLGEGGPGRRLHDSYPPRMSGVPRSINAA